MIKTAASYTHAENRVEITFNNPNQYEILIMFPDQTDLKERKPEESRRCDILCVVPLLENSQYYADLKSGRTKGVMEQLEHTINHYSKIFPAKKENKRAYVVCLNLRPKRTAQPSFQKRYRQFIEKTGMTIDYVESPFCVNISGKKAAHSDF